MGELGIAPTNVSIATHYAGLIDALVVDHADEADRTAIDIPVFTSSTLMNDLGDRERLAGDVLRFADEIRKAKSNGRRTLTRAEALAS